MNDFYTLLLEQKRLILSSAETKIGLPVMPPIRNQDAYLYVIRQSCRSNIII